MRGLWQRFARNRSALLGLVILSIVILIAITAPLLFSESPFKVVDKPFLPPFGKYLLGTDSLGRSVAAGIAHGAQTSLLIGLVATFVAVFIGTLFGGFAGYYGRWIDDVLMRLTEFFQKIPYFIRSEEHTSDPPSRKRIT